MIRASKRGQPYEAQQAHRRLDRATQEAARVFLARAAERYLVADARLFGSRARGDSRADSDADIALLLAGAVGAFLDTKLELADIAYDVLLETGIRIPGDADLGAPLSHFFAPRNQRYAQSQTTSARMVAAKRPPSCSSRRHSTCV